MRITMQAVLWLCLAFPAPAQEKLTEHTFALSAGEAPPAATLADIAWFAGHWRGTGFGGLAEEMWGAPLGGSMVGWLRMLKEGAPEFYEMQLLVESAGTLLLRVKHFGPDFEGWEERDESADFPLVAREGDTLYFNGITYAPRNDGGALDIYVAVRQKDGSYREEVFRYQRVTAF